MMFLNEAGYKGTSQVEQTYSYALQEALTCDYT